MEPQSHEPTSEAGARAAQLAAMSLSVAEALARLRAQHVIDQNLRRHQRAERQRAAARTARATARRTWAPSLTRRWLRAADSHTLLTAWSAAWPWATVDPMAAAATTRIEQRLHELHPEAMRRYHQARAGGARHDAAMRDASTAFRPRPAIDMPRGDATLHHRPTQPSGPSGSSQSRVSDLVIVGESFPTPIEDALTTGPNFGAGEAISVTSLPRHLSQQRFRTPGGPS
jgi:hypothetical protein